LRTKDLAWVTIDTTVQSKNITFPIDAKLLHVSNQRAHDGGTLCPCQAVQSPSSTIARLRDDPKSEMEIVEIFTRIAGELGKD
jgi:hypothetical protein